MMATLNQGWDRIKPTMQARVFLTFLCALEALHTARPAYAADPPPPPMTPAQIMANNLAIHNAGASASTPTALAAGITSACGIQAWQFSLQPVNDKGRLKLAVSPTLSADTLECINAVVSASLFFIAP